MLAWVYEVTGQATTRRPITTRSSLCITSFTVGVQIVQSQTPPPMVPHPGKTLVVGATGERPADLRRCGCHNGSVSSAASSGSESTPAASGADPEVPELPQTFRLSKLAYFAVPMAFLVALVLAGASLPWLGWTLILPVFLALWIARIRTVVTEDGLRAVSTFSARDVSWPEIEACSSPSGVRCVRYSPTTPG